MSELVNNGSAAPSVLLTPEGYQRLKDELHDLTHRRRAEIADRLRDSKDHGEFSEDNNELDEVKFEQAMIESRINDLKLIFSNAQVVDPAMLPGDEVGIGAWITLSDLERGFEFEVRLVSPFEADPDLDYVSSESPMGLALLDAKLGTTISFEAPAGQISYSIKSIRVK